jgi:beta-lactam-binding protein with PASTA domain
MDQSSNSVPDKNKPAEPGMLKSVLGFFMSRQFLKTVVTLIGLVAISFFLLNAGLKWYTNHGQRLEVSNYIDMKLNDASLQIERSGFRLEIIDSVFLVDRPPHVVLRQDPAPGSFVKEDRRIYLTVTKAIADEVELPSLAGTYDFDRYLRKLTMLDVQGKVKERVYSNRYQANTILKVFYEGREVSESELKAGFKIPKGSMLEFTVTSKAGGLADVPKLTCLTLEEAKFLIQDYRLRTGRIQADATVSNKELAYIWRQDPPYSPGATIPFESEVHLFLTAKRPEDCDSL